VQTHLILIKPDHCRCTALYYS